MDEDRIRAGARASRSRGRADYRRRLFALLALVVMAGLTHGCSQRPRGPAFKPSPWPQNTHGRVYVYRIDPRPQMSDVGLTINGRSLGEMRDREYTTFTLTPGSHRLRARMRGFAYLSWGWNEHTIRIAAGEEVYVELAVRLEGSAGTIPPPRDATIAGRPSSTARNNVFITRKPANQARTELTTTTQMVSETQHR